MVHGLAKHGVEKIKKKELLFKNVELIVFNKTEFRVYA